MYPPQGAPMGQGLQGAMPTGAGPNGAAIDQVTRALQAIQQPPPQPPALQGPMAPTMSAPMGGPAPPPLSTPPAAAFPGGGMTGAVPNAPTASQPMGGPPMPQRPGQALMQQPLPQG